MIGVAFAVPHEAADFIKALDGADAFNIGRLPCVTGKLKNRAIVVGCLGMGLANAGPGAEILLQHFRIKALILGGYGGGLVPQIKRGQVILSSNFTSEAMQPYLRLLPGFAFAKTCSADEVVATPERKALYAQQTGCQVVDMETSAVSDALLPRDIPLIVARGISDDANQTLPRGALAAGFNPTLNRVTPGRLLGYLCAHPGEIAPFRKFVAGLPAVRRAMTDFIIQLANELPANLVVKFDETESRKQLCSQTEFGNEEKTEKWVARSLTLQKDGFRRRWTTPEGYDTRLDWM